MNPAAGAAGTLPSPVIPPRLIPGYPGPGHWHRVPSTGQHYVRMGAGDPILLLHGNPSWSYAWRRLLPLLSPECLCVAPDLLGMGMSPRPVMPEDALGRFLAHLGSLDALISYLVGDQGLPARGWTLVLHDWGGPLGIAWALRNPGVVARVVVLNTIGFRWPPGYRVPFYLRWIRDHRPVAALAHATNAFPRAAVRLGVAAPLSRAQRHAYLVPYARRRDRRSVVEFVRAIPRDGDDRLWQLLVPAAGNDLARLPLFVGWGMRDPVFSPLVLGEWIRRYPHAVVRRYPKAGHFVMEDAADELGGHIVEFLTREGGTS